MGCNYVHAINSTAGDPAWMSDHIQKKTIDAIT